MPPQYFTIHPGIPEVRCATSHVPSKFAFRLSMLPPEGLPTASAATAAATNPPAIHFMELLLENPPVSTTLAAPSACL